MGILKKIYRQAVFMVALSIVFSNMAPPVYAAETVRLQEQKIKAGLFYNFIKYTSWPKNTFKDSGEAFQICLLGGDGFEGALDALQGRTVQTRSINIRQISLTNSLAKCHAVFIHDSQAENLAEILAAAKNYPVLLVSDMDSFSRKGGMVEFSNPTRQRIELSLNKEAIAQAGLRVGDQLLKLAQIR